MPATRVVRASPEATKEASSILAAGGLVAFPTETVYGLGADATDDAAVAKLYAAKERPSFNPLIVHLPDLAAAQRIAAFDARALALAGAFWPGALTLVLRRLPSCPVGLLATAGLDTVAVRLPSHPVARDILQSFGKPVAAPSANRSGRVSSTSAESVKDDLDGRVDLIVDGGPCPVGIESTIVACLDGIALLRPGAVTRDAIAKIVGHAIASPAPDAATPTAPIAPGMLASHYAPRAALRMDAVTVEPGEALLAFGPNLPPNAREARAVLNLSPFGSLTEAAANLFAYLRRLDGSGVAAIAAMPIPEEGLGEAINDRLRHAAAPRDAPARPRLAP